MSDVRRGGNLLGLFAKMLGSLGGTFVPVELEKLDHKKRRERREERFSFRARPVSKEFYYVDSHGSLRRRAPKRDKSISARQWRKQRRIVRDHAREVARRIPA